MVPWPTLGNERPVAGSWWLLVVIEVTSLLMKRIPKRLWRGVHLSSYLVALLSTAHLFTAGTDATSRLVVGAAIAVVAVLVFFLLYRELHPAKRRSRAAAARTARAAQRTVVAPARSVIHS